MKKLIALFFVLLTAEAFAETRFQLTDTIPNMTGNGEYIAFEMAITNGIHTGTDNALYGLKIPNMTLNAGAYGIALDIGQGWHNGIRLATNLPVYFDAVANPTQLYHDGTILSIDKSLKIYGDLNMNWTAIRDVQVLGIRHADLTPGACQIQDEWVIDDGGATKELCVCDSVWECAPLRRGPQD